MGAWGSGSFENDDAADWLAQLGTMEPDDLTKMFGKAAHDTAYFEAPDASIVVAAAEVVAALNGFPVNEVPPEIVKWTANRQKPNNRLRRPTTFSNAVIPTWSTQRCSKTIASATRRFQYRILGRGIFSSGCGL